MRFTPPGIFPRLSEHSHSRLGVDILLLVLRRRLNEVATSGLAHLLASFWETQITRETTTYGLSSPATLVFVSESTPRTSPIAIRYNCPNLGFNFR